MKNAMRNFEYLQISNHLHFKCKVFRCLIKLILQAKSLELYCYSLNKCNHSVKFLEKVKLSLFSIVIINMPDALHLQILLNLF